ncbi:MAG: hypothetical protein IPP83_05210 [Flavobacteriales bacterium]|nr:hypothetical protein [Flavobacteriales bacterium]
MTARLGLMLVLVGLCFFTISVVFKFQDWPMSGLLYVGSMAPTFLGLVILVWKALRYPGFKDFLDS